MQNLVCLIIVRLLGKEEGISGAGINKLRDLLNIATRTNTVVIALTELSILIQTQKERSRKGKTIIDTLDLLANDMANYYTKQINLNQ